MATISQRPAMEVRCPFYEDALTVPVHGPIARYWAVRDQRRYDPDLQFPAFQEHLEQKIRWAKRDGVAVLDHSRDFEKTSLWLSDATRRWLDADELPEEPNLWRRQIKVRKWSERCRPHLLTIPSVLGTFVYCDPLARLDDVPDDLRRAVRIALAEKAEWIDVVDEGPVHVQPSA